MIFSDKINIIKEAILSVSPGAEIILFGSQARKEARPDSDIDILILINSENQTPSYEEKGKILDILFELEITMNIEINPVIRTHHQWFNAPVRTPFFINVMNEGIRVNKRAK